MYKELFMKTKTEDDFKPLADELIKKYINLCLCETPEEKVDAITAFIASALKELELCTSKEQYAFYMGLDK
jgi:ADP-heptose:LPS heptosyltransferase